MKYAERKETEISLCIHFHMYQEIHNIFSLKTDRPWFKNPSVFIKLLLLRIRGMIFIKNEDFVNEVVLFCAIFTRIDIFANITQDQDRKEMTVLRF